MERFTQWVARGVQCVREVVSAGLSALTETPAKVVAAGALVLGLTFTGGDLASAAPIFDVTTLGTDIANVRADVIAWGGALLAVALAIFGWKKVNRVLGR